jgi:hypothetical protein
LPKNSNWCPDIFKNLYIEPINRSEINIGPCCQSEHFSVPIKDFDFRTNSDLQRIRTESLAGIKSAECRRCWQAEEISGMSRRTQVITEYPTDISDDPEIQSLDINVTWACNLACVMCGPKWSSAWAKEVGATDLADIGRANLPSNPYMDSLDITNVRRVHFNGGEPLINHNHSDILKRFNSKNLLDQLNVSYNTNATIYPGDDVIDLWSRAKLVKIYFSIDAVGSQFDYIRYHGIWDQVRSNIARMVAELPSNVMFGVNLTIGCYNIFEITDVVDWFDRELATNREGDVSDFTWNISNGFDITKLNSRAKDAAIAHLKSHHYFNGLAESLLNQYQHSDDSWIQHFDEIDRRRGTNWRQVLAVANYY